MSAEPEQFEKERDLRKERRRKRKRERKQGEILNNIGEGRWRKLGAIASWVGYSVSMEDEQEVVPVRRNASRMELATISHNLKRYIQKKHRLEKQRKQKEQQKRRRIRRTRT